MHMADALLSPGVAATMYLCTGVATCYAVHKLKKEPEEKIAPLMGVMGAFVFAAQMINFAIPGTGSSGHLCGGLLLAAIVGPYAGFLTMIGILLLQCLLFADGGLMSLGANIWNMAFYGCFISGGLIWSLAMRHGLSKKKIVVTSILGGIIALQLGAFSVVLQTLASDITALPFSAFLIAMQPIHLAIGIVEGGITAAVLVFLYQARPDLIWTGSRRSPTPHAISRKAVLGAISVIAIMIAGGISLLASSLPDGLEWSVERLTGQTEIEAPVDGVYALSANIQQSTAKLPDYNFVNSESRAGNSTAGIVGAILALLLCLLIGRVIRQITHRHGQIESGH